jgi:hypothetical protein
LEKLNNFPLIPMVVSLDMQGGEHKQEKIWIKKAITKIATIMSYIGKIA